ncbi:hypothetical protein [Tunicatimonas pelagia]|uniref:hypothetical protein n=1 Tax=Tunicatimonas pelagia TaxID=931531 RepID=UPI0026650326|nr:hypothetical protein [Tunicatimonas pelagia]WKN46447.1 hypothetical protein P0M28_30830 [Tunicatimonas pelagia]
MNKVATIQQRSGTSDDKPVSLFIATDVQGQHYATKELHLNAEKTSWSAISSTQYEQVRKQLPSHSSIYEQQSSNQYQSIGKSNHPVLKAAYETELYLRNRNRFSEPTKESLVIQQTLHRELTKPLALHTDEISNPVQPVMTQALRQGHRIMQQDYLKAMDHEKKANEQYVQKTSNLSEAGRQYHLSYHERNEFKMPDGNFASHNIKRIEQVYSALAENNPDQLPIKDQRSKREKVIESAYQRMWRERTYVAPEKIQALLKDLQQDPTLKPSYSGLDTRELHEKKGRIENMNYHKLQPHELTEGYYRERKAGENHEVALNKVADHITKKVSITTQPDYYRELVVGKNDHYELSKSNLESVNNQLQTIEKIHQSVDYPKGLQQFITSRDKRLDRAFSSTEQLSPPTRSSVPLPATYQRLVDKISEDQKVLKQNQVTNLVNEYQNKGKEASVQITSFEKFKGEISGEFTKLYVGTDSKKNRYVTHNLEFKQLKDDITIDLEKTQWKPVTEKQYKTYQRQLHSLGVSHLRTNPNQQVQTESAVETSRDSLKKNYPQLSSEDVNRYQGILKQRASQSPVKSNQAEIGL